MSSQIVSLPIVYLWLGLGYAGAVTFAFFGLFMLLVINREAFFWFCRRFSSKIVVADFDDSGALDFKAEKSIGQGVTRGEGNNNYSMIPRNLSRNLGSYVNEETNIRFNRAITEIAHATPKESPINISPTLYNEIRKAVIDEIRSTTPGTLDVVDYLNNFRCYAKGLKVPVFVRYSGKAVVVNPIISVVSSQDRDAIIETPKPGNRKGEKVYARVQDLKTFFTRMITPSQITYISKRSEMIGAKQLSEGASPIFFVFIMVAVVGILAIVYLYVLPALGIKI